MRQYKSHLKVIGFLTGLMLATLLLAQCASIEIQKADYKVITMWNTSGDSFFNVTVPVSMPNFFKPPYTLSGSVSYEADTGVMIFRDPANPENHFAIAVVIQYYDGELKPRVYALYDSANDAWYIYPELDGLPVESTGEGFIAYNKEIVNRPVEL